MNGGSYLELLRLTSPELVMALSALMLLVLDLSVLRRFTLAMRFRILTTGAIGGCAMAMLTVARWAALGALPAGLLVVTPLTQLMQQALLLLTILILLLAASARFTTHAGEYCALILFATSAMMLMVSTQNLLMLFITIEFLSLSLYVLTGFDKQSRDAAEAGLKYFLFGGMSAGILLFGMSLLYGISGSLALPSIAAAVQRSPGDPLLSLAIVMVIAGFSFKIAAAPFHMWAPEVYRGAPTVSAALIASSSKVASFFALFVVFYSGLGAASGSAQWGHSSAGWALVIALLAVASMLWGNLGAIAQVSVRRLLAYSAVGHAGYMLLALVSHSGRSLVSVVYYVITYALATAGAFAVLVALQAEGVDRVEDFRGLSTRAPGLSFCLLVFLLSLAGIPPLAGFFGKFLLFASVLDAGDPGLLWLVLLAIGMSVVSFFYYLKVLKQVYVVESVAEAAEIKPALSVLVVVWVAAGLVLLLGCLPGLLLSRIIL